MTEQFFVLEGINMTAVDFSDSNKAFASFYPNTNVSLFPHIDLSETVKIHGNDTSRYVEVPKHKGMIGDLSRCNRIVHPVSPRGESHSIGDSNNPHLSLHHS